MNERHFKVMGIVLAVLITAAILFTGCGNVDKPADTASVVASDAAGAGTTAVSAANGTW